LLGLVLCVPSSALTLMVGWQEGRPSHRKICSTNIQRFFRELVEDEDPRVNQWTQIHPEKWPLNGNSCSLRFVFPNNTKMSPGTVSE